MDDLLLAETKAAEMQRIASELAALLPVTDLDTQRRLARMQDDADVIQWRLSKTVRKRIPATLCTA